MEEDFEAEKIRLLEDCIKQFEKPTNGDRVTPSLMPPIANAHNREHSHLSELSSDDDSLGQGSE